MTDEEWVDGGALDDHPWYERVLWHHRPQSPFRRCIVRMEPERGRQPMPQRFPSLQGPNISVYRESGSGKLALEGEWGRPIRVFT